MRADATCLGGSRPGGGGQNRLRQRVAQWILCHGRYDLFGFPTILVGLGSVFRFKYA